MTSVKTKCLSIPAKSGSIYVYVFDLYKALCGLKVVNFENKTLNRLTVSRNHLEFAERKKRSVIVIAVCCLLNRRKVK